jgi:hypothetical protein
MTETLLDVEATTAEGLRRLIVQSRAASSATSSGSLVSTPTSRARFNGLTATFIDANLERLKERIVASRR